MNKSVFRFFLYFLSSFLLFSCSLNYGSEKNEKIRAPDLLFENLRMTKVENGKISAQIQAGTLEEYTNSDSSFAENVNFTLFDEKGRITVEGHSDLLSAETDSEIYTLFNNIQISSYDQNMKIMAQGLKWNSKTEQLTAPKDHSVSLSNDVVRDENKSYVESESDSKTKMSFSGTGFSASGLTKTYRFENRLHGTIQTDSEE
ncbi:MAG: LPS export ABC transporter periplasmic protein LptC [Treponemataceae bacterium]|nr:LPS export ABC transporter periplasmic protein LptC [Treponemataceae bacterium]